MIKADWEKIKEVFYQVLDQPADSRHKFLEEVCASDKNLMNEVESLLEAHNEPENLLEKNALEFDSVFEKSSENHQNEKFGNYRIVKEIGRGGMGAVFLAERADGEFEQKVALKIIHQSFTNKELERHFRRERQILASLNHPNIAKLLDGGVSETGELFLAMEYIEGESLLDFVENQQLNIEERLNLFLKICNAVFFAHQNLIIHRDIKPSNIIITKDREAKLLDFGLAKALDESLAFGENAQTDTVFRAFTPAYASPEQILGKPVSIASDIYSLGVVLYELLTGDRPFHFEDKSLEEIIKTISDSDSEPLRPSAIVNSNSANQNPKSKIQNLKFLRGDLDNILLTALRKEPERRYKSVEALADDINRNLKGLPIKARPNTFSYKASKFIKRNKIAVIAVSLILLSLIGGLAISVWQYRAAQREAAKAEAVNAFMQKMLLKANPATNNPTGKTGFKVTLNDVMDEAVKNLESDELAKQPEVKADILQLIGNNYTAQGEIDKAEKILQETMALKTELYGENSDELITTKITLATVFQTKADLDKAEKIYQQILPKLTELYKKGKLDSDNLLSCVNNYALLCRARGDSKQAEKLYRDNLKIALENNFGTNNIVAVQTLLSLTLLDQGNFNEAENYLRKSIDILKQQAIKESSELSGLQTMLGSVSMEKGNFTEAESNLLEAENTYRKLFSSNYLPIYDNLRLQAQLLYLEGKYSQAEEKINQVLEGYNKNSTPKYINFATALTIKGLILSKLNKNDEAELALREALKLRNENLPPNHFMTALTKGALGEILTNQKKFAEAETLLQESYESLKLSQTDENPRIITAKNRLTELYKAQGAITKPISTQQY